MEEFFDIKDPYDYSTLTDADFLQFVVNEVIHHAKKNDLYRKFLEKKNFNINLPHHNDLFSVPFIPVQVFKKLGDKLRTVDENEIVLRLNSSATSGIPSTVLIDKITSRRQIRAMAKVLSNYIGSQRKPFLIIDVSPYDNSGGLGARTAAVRGYLNFASTSHFFLENVGPDLVLDDKRVVSHIEHLDPDKPVVLFGFTYILFQKLVYPFSNGNVKLKLPKGSKVIHIGGWKKLETEKVSKEEFNNRTSNLFGIHANDVIDIYGFTEQMGINYPDCEYGWKHVPNFARVIVRDPESHAVKKPNQAGALQFVSPLPHSYPGNSVLTDDMGFIDETPCECGRGGQRFKITGRIKKAEIRGCGDILGEKIKVQTNANNIESISQFQQTGLITKYGDSDIKMDVKILLSEISSRKDWINKQPVDALIGLINQVSSEWLSNQDLIEWKYQGLSFLVNWCNENNLKKILSQSLKGKRRFLDDFYTMEGDKGHQWFARPVGVVSHWLAGNVPLLGMLVLVQCIITKNVNILKLPANNNNALKKLLDTFKGKEYITPGGFRILGDDLLSTIALIYYDRRDKIAADELSIGADARVAWGGAEAIDTISNLPSKTGCIDLIFGPKTSFMVISKESIRDARNFRKLIRKSAIDSSVFDQYACASPHTIFVENNDNYPPFKFAQELANWMDKTLFTIPKSDEDYDTLVEIQTARAVADFNGWVWKGKGGTWTVIYDESLLLAKPTYSRVITVKPVDSINEVIPLITNNIQTIGLAAEGKKKVNFAIDAAKMGAIRFPEIGKMTNFEAPWDGIFPIEKLVKWVSLGGPG